MNGCIGRTLLCKLCKNAWGLCSGGTAIALALEACLDMQQQVQLSHHMMHRQWSVQGLYCMAKAEILFA